MAVEGHDRRRGGQGNLAAEHLVEDDTQGIDVGAAVDGLHQGVLRGHVLGGADADARPRQARGLVEQPGNAEIGQQGAHVGLDVAVDDALLVGVVQGIGQLGGDGDGQIDLQRPAVDLVPQRAAAGIAHGYVVDAVDDAGVVDMQDVGMVELGHGQCFPPEAGNECRVPGEFAAQHFDGHVATQRGLVAFVDHGHRALADPLHDLVRAQGPAGQVGHGSRSLPFRRQR
jgi:hypothetical protein